MSLITTERNLKSIGPGLEESGVAGEAMEAGDVVDYSSGDEFTKATADYSGTVGVVKNSYPGVDDTVEAGDNIKLRLTGLVIVQAATGETIQDGDLVASAGDGKVKAISETDVSGVGAESASGSLLGQAMSEAIGIAKQPAAGDEELVMQMI